MGTGGGAGQLGCVAESGAEERQERAENRGKGVIHEVRQVRDGAAAAGLDGGQVDGEGTGGEVRGAGPAVGDGEDHGTAKGALDGFGVAVAELFVVGDAETGAEAAEGGGDVGGEARDVVEGDDPVAAGESDEIADGGGSRGERGGDGIDEGAEDAGGEGFAGAGGAAEDEDGMGSFGAEGGEEPGEAAEPIGVGGEVEAGAEDFERGERVGLGAGRDGDGVGDGGRFERRVAAGGLDVPSGGGDFEEAAGGIGEVEEEGGGTGGAIAGADAAVDAEAELIGIAEGAGFEEVEGGAEGVGRRDGGEVRGVLAEEPVAEGGGADWDGAEGEEVGGTGDVGVGAVLGRGEDLEVLGDAADYGFGH